MKKLSQKLKLFIAISIIWIIFAYIFIILDVRYPDSEEYIEFLLITAPVWISWLAYWIWENDFIKLVMKLKNKLFVSRKVNANDLINRNRLNDLKKALEAKNESNVSEYIPFQWLRYLFILYLFSILYVLLNPSTYLQFVVSNKESGYFYTMGIFLATCILPLLIAVVRLIIVPKPRNKQFLQGTNYIYLLLIFTHSVIVPINSMQKFKVGILYDFNSTHTLVFLFYHVVYGLVFFSVPTLIILSGYRTFIHRINRNKDLR